MRVVGKSVADFLKMEEEKIVYQVYVLWKSLWKTFVKHNILGILLNTTTSLGKKLLT